MPFPPVASCTSKGGDAALSAHSRSSDDGYFLSVGKDLPEFCQICREEAAGWNQDMGLSEQQRRAPELGLAMFWRTQGLFKRTYRGERLQETRRTIIGFQLQKENMTQIMKTENPETPKITSVQDKCSDFKKSFGGLMFED